MNRVLTCIYDMMVNPCSYDFFTFLISAEICRIRRNLSEIKLIFVQGPNDKFRADKLRSNEQNKVFFENVIIPGISLLPSCESFSWINRCELKIDHLGENNLFPRSYNPRLPSNDYSGGYLVASHLRGDDTAIFQAPTYAVDFVQNFLRNKLSNEKFVTLTVREINRDNHNNTRSLNIEVWQGVIDKLRKEKIDTIIIRDTFFAHDKPLFKGAIEVPEASIHLPFRAALYEGSVVNFTKNNGPAIINLHGRNDAVYFNQFDNDVVALSEAFYGGTLGMAHGSQFPMTRKNKTVIWSAENKDIIFSRVRTSLANSVDFDTKPHTLTHKQKYLSLVPATRSLFQGLHGNEVLQEDIDLYIELIRIFDQWKVSPTLDQLLVEYAQKRGSNKFIINKLIELAKKEKKMVS